MNAILYERLGGAPGIASLVDDVIAAHLVNPVVKTRFENIKDLQHAKRMAREFFCAGSGGPEVYTGRAPSFSSTRSRPHSTSGR